MHIPTIVLLIFCAWTVRAQVQQFPFTENFDSVTVPSLPPGWSTTTNRSPSGDFATTKSTPHSDSTAVISTNATITQNLISPRLDFSTKEADSLKFYERRSSSHNSGVIIEASVDAGATFPIVISDTLKNPGVTSYILRVLRLPPTLSNQTRCRIRWRVIGNGTGTSGTLRFDDIIITALAHIDAEVIAVRFSPNLPVTGDSVFVQATVRNAGTQTIQNIPVEFYDDINNNNLPEPSELIFSMTMTVSLQPGDTAIAETKLSNLTFGKKHLIVRTALAQDQNPLNNQRSATLSVGVPRFTIVVNEIMYSPENPEPEWIELTSNTTDSINVSQWGISDRNSGTQYKIDSVDQWMKRGDYIVITKDSARFTDRHPDVRRIIFIPSMPSSLFNNDSDAVVLFDERRAIIDSIHYTSIWGGTGGRSLERIESSHSSNDSLNWGLSADSSGSTPGKQNYLTPLEHDLRAVRLSAVNSTPTSTFISVVVRNMGRQSANSFSVLLYYDANGDHVAQPMELLESQAALSPLPPRDSTSFTFNWNNPSSGKKSFITTIDFPQDMRPSDNIVIDSINISFTSNSLIINEIMYEPRTGQAEYVELFNRSTAPIDVREWRLSDVRDTNERSTTHIVSQSSMIIEAGEYVVVASDSSILQSYPYLTDSGSHLVIRRSGISLNNQGDNILLTDLTGRTIDSVHYLPTWHNAGVEDVLGRSLERINPNLPGNDRRNWSTSASPTGGTPGKQNTLYTTAVPAATALSFSPNPFSPDGDGFEDVTLVSYELPATTAIVRVRIYDAKGRLIRTLADGEPSGSRGQLVWDGFTDNHDRARMGIYIVLLEALDAYGGNVQNVKGVVVVAAKM